MEINNNLKINEYVSIAQLKRKLKAYLAEQGNSDFKPSIFAKGLIVSLVMVLEELVGDCLKSVNKEKSGLYTIDQLVLTNLFGSSDKYEFVSRYMRKYSSTLRYHESIFFNFNKVITNLEDKHGSKLMVGMEAKNIIAYIILSIQYDIIELSVSMVKYAGRKTLNINVLEIVCGYILSNDISNKIKLKLDSINISNGGGDEDVDEEDSDENSETKLETEQEQVKEQVKESEPIKEKKKKTNETKEQNEKIVKETTDGANVENNVDNTEKTKKTKPKTK